MRAQSVAGGWIVDLSLGSDQGGAEIDIAAAICRVVTSIGNCECAANLLVVNGAEIITEEEQLVLDDGSADAAAEVVIREVAERPGKIGAGVDGVVLNELEGRTVELAGSGLEGDVGNGAD